MNTQHYDFESEKAELLNKKSEMMLSRKAHEARLHSIKNTIRAAGILPPDEYKKYCDLQSIHVRSIFTIETEIAPIKKRLREIASLEFKARQDLTWSESPR